MSAESFTTGPFDKWGNGENVDPWFRDHKCLQAWYESRPCGYWLNPEHHEEHPWHDFVKWDEQPVGNAFVYVVFKPGGGNNYFVGGTRGLKEGKSLDVMRDLALQWLDRENKSLIALHAREVWGCRSLDDYQCTGGSRSGAGKVKLTRLWNILIPRLGGPEEWQNDWYNAMIQKHVNQFIAVCAHRDRTSQLTKGYRPANRLLVDPELLPPGVRLTKDQQRRTKQG